MCAGNQMLLFQLGRPDRYLKPYYFQSLKQGCLTRAAQELIDCLVFCSTNTRRQAWRWGGWSAAATRAARTSAMICPVSSCEQSAMSEWRIPVSAVLDADTPDDLMELSCRLLARGYTIRAVQRRRDHTRPDAPWLSHRDACLYIHSTCVEITPIALSNVYVASPYYNLVQCCMTYSEFRRSAKIGRTARDRDVRQSARQTSHKASGHYPGGLRIGE